MRETIKTNPVPVSVLATVMTCWESCVPLLTDRWLRAHSVGSQQHYWSAELPGYHDHHNLLATKKFILENISIWWQMDQSSQHDFNKLFRPIFQRNLIQNNGLIDKMNLHFFGNYWNKGTQYQMLQSQAWCRKWWYLSTNYVLPIPLNNFNFSILSAVKCFSNAPLTLSGHFRLWPE